MGPGRSGVLALVEASARDEADAKGALDGGEAQEFQNGSVSVAGREEGLRTFRELELGRSDFGSVGMEVPSACLRGGASWRGLPYSSVWGRQDSRAS